MYDYISGEVIDLTPSNVVIDVNGIGYFVNISINSYEKINTQKHAKVYIHQIIKEDSNEFFGFTEKEEREIFRQLISVSGIGASTARLMLSSMKPERINEAIITADVTALKNIKGIGLKTAQRIIVDLKDKVGKIKSTDSIPFETQNLTNANEAITALVALGFSRKNSEQVIYDFIKKNPNSTIEDLVKSGIKTMSK